MPILINKHLSISVLFILILCVFLSGCIGASGPDPTLTPTEVQPTETISFEIQALFDRYTVVGITEGSVLSIYEKPSPDSQVLGDVPAYGTDILPTGEVHQSGNSIWAYVNYQESAGWVDMEFLAEQHGTLPEELIILGQQVLGALKTEKYTQLLPLLHPETCLRFSPYQYLNTDNQIICPSDLASFTSSQEPISWGHFDGTGHPIDLIFFDYHQKFIYDQDYLKSSVVGFNLEVSSGNSINNIEEIYPNGLMIEYYFPGIDPQYGGMDWRSLRLVFVPENDQWYLAAIIHGEWTI